MRYCFRNILSYRSGTKFTGREITKWATYHYNRRTGRYKQAKTILKNFSNLVPDRYYTIETSHKTSGTGQIRKEILICRV